MPAKKKDHDLVETDPTAQVPATLDYGDDAELGYENQTSADLKPAFLNVLQAGSPEVLAEDSTLKAGMLYNTGTKEAVKGSEGLIIIPVKTEHLFVEWIPRSQGGGFVATHKPESDIVLKAKAESKKFGKYSVGDHDLVETFYIYALNVATRSYMIFPLASTKIGPYRDWNTETRLFDYTAFNIPKRPPIFAHQVRVTTVLEKRPGKGDSYTVCLQPAYPETEVNGEKRPAIVNSMIGVDNPLYLDAKKFLKSYNEGNVQVDYESAGQEPDMTVHTTVSDDDRNVPW